MGYTFIKDYKHNDKMRLSFCSLAKDTFGIDLETWYNRGFWNDNYVCYSFEYGGEIVSNVSLSTMNLIMDGRQRPAVQIGTVMTSSAHRGKGLAKELLERAISDYQRCGFFFLSAAEKAVPLYKGCGFETVSACRNFIDLTGYRRAEKPLLPVNVSAEELLAAKRRSAPLSRILSAAGDEHILMFYYLNGFAKHIYKPWPDTYAIFMTEGNTVRLYDVLSPGKIELAALLERIAPAFIREVECCFTPDSETMGISSLPDIEAGWMVRGGSFPEGSCFPKISET